MKSVTLFSIPLLSVSLPAQVAAQTQVIFNTNLGDIPMTLFDSQAPETVANFLGYIERGDYDNSIFHRLVDGFVLQGGGFALTDPGSSNLVDSIPTVSPVVNEPGISNTRGTVAMAKLGGDPDSATSQWFVNLDDNSSNLDSQNGGFTVFGEVTDMTVVDEIAARPVASFASPFNSLPLAQYDPLVAVTKDDLIVIQGVSVVPEPSISGLMLAGGLLGLLRRKRSSFHRS
jgi:peptidyl-prolyl cis-trans isomerase A (cyclophilin A)